jgi:hypothetical protein
MRYHPPILEKSCGVLSCPRPAGVIAIGELATFLNRGDILMSRCMCIPSYLNVELSVWPKELPSPSRVMRGLVSRDFSVACISWLL